MRNRRIDLGVTQKWMAQWKIRWKASITIAPCNYKVEIDLGELIADLQQGIEKIGAKDGLKKDILTHISPDKVI